MVCLKHTLRRLLEDVPRRRRSQQVFDLLLSLLILANVLAVILGTVNGVAAEYAAWIEAFEVFSVAVFSAELILRFWVADIAAASGWEVSRWGFWRNPYNLVDMVAIVPFYLGFMIDVDLRLLRLLRLFRLLRFSPFFRSLGLLGSVIRLEYRPIASALSVIVILMLFAAAGIYLLEREWQPDTFGDLPSALWWVVVTLSTVGYGDAIPQTGLGRMLGAAIMILGIGMVALPAGMLASRFSEVIHQQQELFRRHVEESIQANGSQPEEVFEELRQELLLSRAEARSIIAHCIDESQRHLNYRLHCGKRLHQRQ